MYKNLKIAINDQQPLDEVVKELERLGYVKRSISVGKIRSVFTCDTGIYDLFYGDYDFNCKTTTLAELKEM